jgi:hypothetical protein
MAQMASVSAELKQALIQEWTRNAMDVKRSREERISGHALSAATSVRGRVLAVDDTVDRVALLQQLDDLLARLRIEGLARSLAQSSSTDGCGGQKTIAGSAKMMANRRRIEAGVDAAE